MTTPSCALHFALRELAPHWLPGLSATGAVRRSSLRWAPPTQGVWRSCGWGWGRSDGFVSACAHALRASTGLLPGAGFVLTSARARAWMCRRAFYDQRIAAEVAGDALGDEYKGYIFRIAGGNDKQGFPMRQGIMVDHRVKILMSKGHACYRPRVKGERKRKAVRGCIVNADMAVLHLVVVKKGEEEIPGLTDREIPRRKAPKRANKIRKLFNLTKEDDVTQYVIRREIPGKDGKKGYSKAPKIQRLVTPQVLQRKRARLALKKKWSAKSKAAHAEYEQMMAARSKAKRAEQASKRSKRSGSKA